MASFCITRANFTADSQGKTFSDVTSEFPDVFDSVLSFFSDEQRQRRMEDAEIHHDRAPLAGVVRELEALQDVDQLLNFSNSKKTRRLRQAIGVVVRIVMEQRGWQKTGRKGSMGIRSAEKLTAPAHNSGGLSFWFARAERYELVAGMPYQTVRSRLHQYEASQQKMAEVN